MDKKTKFVIVLGMAFACYIAYALIDMTDRFISFQTLLNVVILTAVLICFAGLWMSRRRALYWSLALALAALGWGIYLEHFVWTFWIFQAPTLWERIGNVCHPRVSVFVVFPAFWIFYFTRAKVRAFFNR